MKKLFVFVFFLLFFTSALLVQAQGTPPSSSNTAAVQGQKVPADILILLKKDPRALTKEEREKITLFIESRQLPSSSSTTPSGATNCFDYYHFGSVQVDLSPLSPIPGQVSVPAGGSIGFVGEVKNNNSYPLVDGQVYVKIFRQRAGEKFDRENGFDLVDQFPLNETFTLPANASKKTSFSWKVPENASAGDYTATFFFQTAKRYNLLGLSFTDDVTGNQTHFTVVGGNKNGVILDKNTVTLNKQTQRFAAYPLHFTKDEPVVVVIKLVNSKNESVTVPVTWKLYSWDGLREEALKNKKAESIQLKPNEIKEISYVASPIDAVVSYLVVEASDKTNKSILNIRFVRDGIEETRINFPGIANYPLEKGKENTLFSCVHATSDGSVKDNTLILTLRDEKENIIHSYKYVGDVTNAMMGVKDLFTPTKNYSTFSLTATLTHKGKIVEEVKEVYDCRDIDANLCPKPSTGIVPEIVAGALALLFVSILGWKVRGVYKKRSGKFLTILLLIFASSVFMLVAPGKVEAKSSTVTSSVLGGGVVGYWEGYANPGGEGVAGVYTSATYNATASVGGVPINDGDTVIAGSTIRVQWNPSSTDIWWVGTGGTYDSPYGRWAASPYGCYGFNECSMINSKDLSTTYCADEWCSYMVTTSYFLYYQGDFIVAPPAFSVSGSGVSCGATQSNGSSYYSDCTVTAASGGVSISAYYPDTSAYLRITEFMTYNGSGPTWIRGGGSGASMPATSIPFSFNAVTPTPPPAINNVTISNGVVVTNAVNQYTITSTATDSTGGSSITDELALVNYQGPNNGIYRGYLGWSSVGFHFFGNSYKTAPISCSGGGSGSIYNGYGPEYINLISCSTSVSGNTRTVSYVVTFNTNFTSPINSNTLSGFAYNNTTGLYSGWVPFSAFSITPTCSNGANNYPTCTTCSTPLGWNGSICTVCSNGGCTDGNCNNGANNPVSCSTCTSPGFLWQGSTNSCIAVTPPIASITSPAINITINEGQNQQFTGTATDVDGTVVAYEWRTNNCATGTILSSLLSFVKSFSIGTYTVYLRAQDDSGLWSTNCPSRTIEVIANNPIPGVCGSASGVPTQTKPTSNLCNTVGLPGPVVLPVGINTLPENNPAISWSWTCAGEYGGANASCSSGTSCGDGKCQASKGESPATCRADCKVKVIEF